MRVTVDNRYGPQTDNQGLKDSHEISRETQFRTPHRTAPRRLAGRAGFPAAQTRRRSSILIVHPHPVSVTAAVAEDVPTYLDANRQNRGARSRLHSRRRFHGRITKIHFTDGADVKKGQMLFTIDTRPFEANLRQAQANVQKDTALKKQAEANLTKEIAQANWGQTQANRYRVLVEQGVVAREQYEELRAKPGFAKRESRFRARGGGNSADETIKVDYGCGRERERFNSVIAAFVHLLTGAPASDLADVGNVVNPGGGAGTSASSGELRKQWQRAAGDRNDLIRSTRISQFHKTTLAEVQQQMRAGRLRAEVRILTRPTSR